MAWLEIFIIVYIVGMFVSTLVFTKIGHPVNGKHKDMFSSDFTGEKCKTHGELWVGSFLASTIWPALLIVYLIENSMKIEQG